MLPAARWTALASLALLVTAPLAFVPATSAPAENPEEWLSTTALLALRGLPAPYAVPDADPIVASNVQVTTNAAAQNEPAVAVNPTDPDNVLAAWNDYSAASGQTQVWDGVGTSHDGGATWNSRLLEPNPKSVPGAVQNVFRTLGIPFTHGGDPILGFNKLGIGAIGQIIFSGDLSSSAISVQTTPNGGDNFLPPVLAAWSGQNVPDGFTDKPWMRGDLNGNNFYICWTHFTGGFSTTEIYFTRSTDGLGLVWSPPMPISTEPTVQGCDIGIGPGGDVYVAYFDFNFGLAGGGPMKVKKSTDGGITFGSSVTIGAATPLSLPNAAHRYNQFPRIAVSQADGAVYVVWAEGTGGDIVMVKSSDGGAGWSAKKVVNNDGTGRAQFFPAIDVAPDGKVVVGFYDKREDVNNRLAKYYLAESTDGGATFPLQVAAGPATIDGLATTWWFMGDYTDLRIGSDGKTHAVFTAAPGSNQDIYSNV